MESPRIILRRWTLDDAATLYRFASDPEVGPRAGWEAHSSIDVSRRVIAEVFDNPTTWAIVLKSCGLPIGAIGYGPSCDSGLPSLPGEPTVGYWVARQYWGQVICTEALRLMIDHVARTTDIRSLVSGHFIDNPASGRVMEKCGFVPTGEQCTSPTLAIGSNKPIRVLRLVIS